ncbi:ABC transporter permease [Formosa sediminum]|uniref:ABC transporter permease n=1 Tax=Formosa sediminum TaxID=2594004 RepID=A0A516GQX2_9FLAO|nr:ABC transporter permease [Formosa sediminum]QDO93934.1 ABC transporter permease [Formosa sediminum]
MNHLSLIIKREYFTKVKNKAFIVMTIISPIVLIALIATVAYLSQISNNKVRTIAILDESGLIKNTFVDTETIKYKYLEHTDLEAAKVLVKAQEDYGLLHIEKSLDVNYLENHVKFYSEDSPSLSVVTSLENKVEKSLTDIKLQQVGVDLDKIESAKIDVSIVQENFSGEKTSKIESIIKLAFGGAAGYLLFMFIIIYGNMIMRSVIEEKTSRVIEVIISSVKPMQLMLGKIIGTSLAGITQISIWIILGGLLTALVGFVFGIDMSQTPQQQVIQQSIFDQQLNGQIETILTGFYHLPLTNLILAFVLFFIAGYLLYSSLYAAIGAAVDNETDTQQFVFPILMPLILSVYIGFFTVIEDPHGTVSTIFSFIPLTSPVVMLMRIPFGVPIWQQLLSLLLLIGSFLCAVWFAAKIYRVGILMYGKKPTYKELIKWIKY